MPVLDPRIKLRHLSCFLEVARQHGVAPAGGALGLSQPAVSKSLAELETILGVALFDRSRRALSLTAEGERFLRFASTALGVLRQGVESVASLGAGTARLAFGALPTVSAGLVPRALTRFARSPLSCRTVVETGPSPYLLGLLRTGEIEFVVGRMANPADMDGLSFEQLYSEELAFAVRPGHPLAAQANVDVKSIGAFPLLLPPPQAIIRPVVDGILLAAGVEREVMEIETVSNSLARSYALISDAVWIISRGVVEMDLATGQLLALPVDVSASKGPIGVTVRSGSDLSLPAEAFLEALRQAARGVREDGGGSQPRVPSP